MRFLGKPPGVNGLIMSVAWDRAFAVLREHLDREGGLGSTGARSALTFSFENYSEKSKVIGKRLRDPSFHISPKMTAMPLQARPQRITFDEYGRPFIILKEQDKQRRLTGLDAQKVSLGTSIDFIVDHHFDQEM